jgi:hypothetical protein
MNNPNPNMNEEQLNELIKINHELITEWGRTHDENQKLWMKIKDVIAYCFLLLGMMQVLTMSLTLWQMKP